MTRTVRLESIALLATWASATALLLLVARIPPPPAVAAGAARASTRAPDTRRRPPTPRPAASAAVAAVADAVEPAAAEPATTEAAAAPEASPVEVVEFEPIDIVGYAGGDYEYEYGYGGEYDPNLEYYRWQYRSRQVAARWSRGYYLRRGRMLRPTASAFLGSPIVPVGTAADPCEVFPSACTEVPQGGAYEPPRAAAPAVNAPSHRAYEAPAEVRREGDRWLLANAQLTLDIDARCFVTARRAGASAPTVVSFAPPVDVACERHEIPAPWDDRAGAAVELTWTAREGSMRAVVALADDAGEAEASVARTDASGETWLTNLGATPLTWTVGGSPVTLAPGAAVRVLARRSARA